MLAEAVLSSRQKEEASHPTDSFTKNGKRLIWKQKLFGIIAPALILVLCHAAAVSADPSKGVYYAGTIHKFMNTLGMIGYFEQTFDGENLDVKHEDFWMANTGFTSYPIGVCAFSGKLYCFYIDKNKALSYITKLPGGGDKTDPAKIVSLSSQGGVAAAVLGGSIYVFTASNTFTTADGKNFSVVSGQSPPNASSMLDAVTFYPLGEDPASIMLLYHNTGGGFLSTIFDGVSFSTPASLPNPANWWVLHGNLILGGSGGSAFSQGALDPCLQFYGLSSEGRQGRWEYNLKNKSWTFTDWTLSGNPIIRLTVYPWFETVDSTNWTVRMLHVLEMEDNQLFHPSYPVRVNPSDYLVPQHNDPVYGWGGTPTSTSVATGDDERDQALRSLWSLVGIVLGPPPFTFNGATDASNLSIVNYGTSKTNSVTTTQATTRTISVSSETTIKAGLAESQLDLSYAHAWTHSHGTSHSAEVSTFYGFGPINETYPDQGIHGWAIFNAPTLLTQWYKLYAWSYDPDNPDSDQNVYLNQDMYVTTLGQVVQQTAYFTLQNPSDGQFQGLFADFPIYPDTTSYDQWAHIKNWNAGGSKWSVIIGDGTQGQQMPTLSLGTQTTLEYTKTDEKLESNSNSNSFSISAGSSFDLFGGFKTGVTVGYETEFETTTEVSSTITESVSCSMTMPIPPINSPDDYVKSLSIQPYWLMAKTAKAPWIPASYKGNLPWCITWDVTSYETVGGKTGGTAPPPQWAWGTLRSGKFNSGSTYTLVGGELSWVSSDGTEKPFSLTADEFDPVAGAEIVLSGYPFSADESRGDWVRYGDVWQYQTSAGTTVDPFELELDFGHRKWSADLSAIATGNSLVADGYLKIQLNLQGKYTFTNYIKHHVNASWSHREDETDWKPFGVHWIEGDYDSSTGRGQVTLAGHMPEEMDLGDIQIVINGVSANFPFLATEAFLDGFKKEQTFAYQAEGIYLELDFETGRWFSFVEGEAFEAGMAPQQGASRVQVFIGGKAVSDQNFLIHEHATVLSYRVL